MIDQTVVLPINVKQSGAQRRSQPVMVEVVFSDLHTWNLTCGSWGSIPSCKPNQQQVTPSGSRTDAALPVQLMGQSSAQQAERMDQRLFGSAAHGTCCKDAEPHRLPLGPSLSTGLHLSWGYKHFIGL